MMKLILVLTVLVSSLHQFSVPSAAAAAAEPLMVPLTLITGAEAKGAVCLDGTPAAYNLHRGYGSGRNSWLIHLEGGGWCDTVQSCVERKTNERELGSSKYMPENELFSGILSNEAKENPDFFNWNRVKLHYCDGASFTGSGQLEADDLFFRGQLIWSFAMEQFMTTEGMQNATQALLSGCSAGGLASIIYCDEFRDLFPQSIKVKCLSDAGLFLDAMDISGRHTQRDMYAGVVRSQGVEKSLLATCTRKVDPTSCFFPQNLIDSIRTPMFLLNPAYDVFQINYTLVPESADPHGDWNRCKRDQLKCNSSQIQVYQDFRNEILDVLKTFSRSHHNGVFINSCFTHCQSEDKMAWVGKDSLEIGKTRVAETVGNWYFDRTEVKAIECPCDHNCPRY